MTIEEVKSLKLRKGNRIKVLYSRVCREENAKYVEVELIKVKYKKVLKDELWQSAKNQYGKLNYIPQAENEDDYTNIYDLVIKEKDLPFNTIYEYKQIFDIIKLDK